MRTGSYKPGSREHRYVTFTAVDQQSSGAGTVRVAGTWFIVAGLLVGFVAAGRPHVGYLFMAGLLVLIGVALRIEAAIRYVNAKADRTGPTGADHYR
jgi:hypothetical protein